jgi:hypothetical protein
VTFEDSALWFGLLKERPRFLLSFWYYRDEPVDELEGMRLIADSGAFSAYTQGNVIVLDEYAAWLTGNEGRFEFAFNLDVLYDPEASWVNWQRLRSLGHDTVPVVHYGTPLDEFDRYASEGADLIGLGGIAVLAAERVASWMRAAIRRCATLSVSTHALGYARPDLLWKAPVWSVDSSAMFEPHRRGKYVLWDPERKRLFTVKDNKPTPEALSILRKWYHPEAAGKVFNIARPLGGWRRVPHLLLEVRAFELWSEDLRARHHVPPPRAGRGDEGTVIWTVAADKLVVRRVAAVARGESSIILRDGTLDPA